MQWYVVDVGPGPENCLSRELRCTEEAYKQGAPRAPPEHRLPIFMVKRKWWIQVITAKESVWIKSNIHKLNSLSEKVNKIRKVRIIIG